MKKFAVTLCLCAAVMTGCMRGASTAQTIGVFNEGYIASLDTVTTLSQTDQIDLEDLERYETFRAPVGDYLDIALQDLLDGDGNDDVATNVVDILGPLVDSLIEAQLEAEREAQNDG